MISSSTPISVPASEPSEPTAITNISCDDNASPQYSPLSFSLVDGDGECGVSALSAALRHSDSLGELRVGSLPMHLRYPSRGGAIHGQDTQSNGSRQLLGPVSLPQPGAPFLSSQEGPKEVLSSMPQVTLPESAVSTNPQSLSSVHYGSLRESRFSRYHQDSSQRQQNNGRTPNADSFQPLSLPRHSQHSGIGAYFHPNSSISFTDTLDSGIITRVFSPRSEADLRLMVDDVEEITEGCTEITLSEDLNCRQSNVVTCSDGGNLLGCEKKQYSSSELAPSISSLTAFDVLTHIRETQITHHDASEDTEPLDEAKSFGNNTSALNGSHQMQSIVSPRIPDDSMFNYGIDYQQINPDTYEAFDFELDG